MFEEEVYRYTETLKRESKDSLLRRISANLSEFVFCENEIDKAINRFKYILLLNELRKR